jgi:alpha-beta hydrolase superfamily lysophospholipase
MSIIDNTPGLPPPPEGAGDSKKALFLRAPDDLIEKPYTVSPDLFASLAHSKKEQRTQFVDGPPCLAMAGLAAAADQWLGVLENHYHITGARYEAHCLKGHEIGWTGLINTRAEDWIQDVIDKAKAIRAETGRRPIIMGHSTGALACIAAVVKYAEENPGDQLCAGLVISSPAFRLRSHLYTGALLGAKILHTLLPRSGVWNKFGASALVSSQPPIDEPIGISENIARAALNTISKIHRLIFKKGDVISETDSAAVTKNYKKSEDTASIKLIPILTFIELRKAQQLASQAVSKLEVPVLAIISRRDYLTNPKSAIDAFRRIPSPDKNSVVLDGPHTLMSDNYSMLKDLDTNPAHAFQTAVEVWMSDREGIFKKQDEDLDSVSKEELMSAPPMHLQRLKHLLELEKKALDETNN